MSNTKDNIILRFATEQDVPSILEFIKGLAEYEKMADQVIATEEILQDSLFVRKAAEVIIAEYQSVPAAFALFFHNFSTFLGKPGIYLEDIYVKPEFRDKGIGSKMISYLAKLAVERNCDRLEWVCLDWNEPSIRFYKQIGAIPMDDWTIYRVQDHALIHLAYQSEND
ncbi:MAG: GCN5-related N-acetyltransferase [Herbinix sp.]|jgi:GNAT superfamily N-acetyltransferase|nr:GCN5-related N-acetyltransferase [Herbinix sp.]